MSPSILVSIPPSINSVYTPILALIFRHTPMSHILWRTSQDEVNHYQKTQLPWLSLQEHYRRPLAEHIYLAQGTR